MSAQSIRPATLIGAAIVVILALAPFFAGSFAISLMNDIGIGALTALGLVLLTGVGGATSIGQAAFMGIAAYATAWLTTAHGLSPWLGLGFALALTAASAVIIGLLTLRLGTHFLPLSTIAWGLSIALLFGTMDALGRHTGLSGIPALTIGPWSLIEGRAMYYLIWATMGLALVFCRNLLASRTGRAIRSLRGGATLLASVGADAFRMRLIVFVIAALCAGLAGWLYAHTNRFVSPSPFDLRASIEYLLMAVVGGVGQLAGAVVGSALVLFFKNTLQDVMPHVLEGGGQVEAIAFAAVFILLMHRARGGVMGRLARIGWLRPRPRVVRPADATKALPRRTLPARGSPVLSVSRVVKRFGGLVAVNDVSFEIAAGEVVGLIGPNGAGKSTMFNLLTRTLPMSAGEVRFLGHDISRMSQSKVARLGIARTFQHVKLRPDMSLLDNVAFGAHARTRKGVIAAGLGLDREEERSVFGEAWRQLERIGLAERAHDLAGSLPLGAQRTLEIARALAADPVLLVLDEPAAGLRRGEKLALGALLRTLADEGVTILIVEHDMEFVMKLVDRLVVMNFGAKLVEGPPRAVRADARVQAAYLGGTS